MRDKRPVDELSITELERILAIKKREARQQRLRQFDDRGRRLPNVLSPLDEHDSDTMPVSVPQQHEAAQEVEPVEPPSTYDLTDDVPRFEDEVNTPPHREPAQRHVVRHRNGRRHAAAPKSRQRVILDNVLLGVEMVGIAGIVTLLIMGVYFVINENSRIEALEEKSAQIQRDAEAMRPTPSPQPELRINLADYVLPGGHVYNEGIATFNFDELPDSLRPVAIAQLYGAPQATITERPVYSPAVIDIPAIDVTASIWGGDDWYSLSKGVGHLLGSANPGEDANMVLSAHNDIYGEIFRDIKLLEPGDLVRVQALDGQWFTYEVYHKEVVLPSDVWVLEPGHEPIVTLITCEPYRVDTHRMVVFARLVEKK